MEEPQKSDKEFTTSDLVSFAKYILSAERSASILYNRQDQSEDDQVAALMEVYSSDIENWEGNSNSELQG